MRYRYRTPALVGQWRSSAEEACGDAIRARQADRGEGSTMLWRASARLETAASDLSRKSPGADLDE